MTSTCRSKTRSPRRPALESTSTSTGCSPSPGAWATRWNTAAPSVPPFWLDTRDRLKPVPMTKRFQADTARSHTLATVRAGARPISAESRAVLRRALIAALLVVTPAASAAPQQLLPGLTYERKVEFTPTGPMVVNVLTVPRPGGLWSIHPVLSNETIPKTEKLTTMEKRLSRGATVAGINGDLFGISGAPTGILMRNGGLDQPPIPGRSSIAIDSS